MEKQNLIADLKNIFPEKNWSWIIPTLQNDPLVWEQIRDTKFRRLVVEKLHRKPLLWTPANLALIAIDPNIPKENLTTNQSPLSIPYILEKAKVLLREYSIKPNPPKSLAEAGYYAIALLDDFNKKKDWNQTFKHVLSTNEPSIFETSLRTALACIYSWFLPPQDFLNALYRISKKESLIIHIILSNPAQPEERTELFTHLVKPYDLNSKFHFVDTLNQYDPKIAQEVAKRIVRRLPRDVFPNHSKSIPSLSEEIQTLLAKDGLYTIASETSNAKQILQKAWESTKNLNNEIALTFAKREVKAGHIENALETWKKMEASSDLELTTDFIIELIQQQYTKEAKNIFNKINGTRGKISSSNGKSHPSLTFVKALMNFKEGNLQDAYKYAKIIREEIQNVNSKTIYHKYSKKNLLSLANLFLDLGYPFDAYQVTSIAQKYYANDLDIVKAHYQSLNLMVPHTEDTLFHEEAINTAHLATTLSPDRIDFRRNLAKAYESARMWDDANNQWVEILDKQATPRIEDLRSYAKCAFQAGFKEQAVKACNYGLSIDSEDGLTYLILAKIHEADEKVKKAYDYYSKALQYSPDEPDVWLGYADSLIKQGKRGEAIAIINRGLNAIPNAPLLHEKIGEIHLLNKDFENAVEQLKIVNKYLNEIPSSKNNELRLKNASSLGDAYYQTGKYKQAIEILKPVHIAHPTDPHIAYQYAKSLLEANQPNKAIQPMVRVLQTNPKEIAPYIDYAKAQIAAENDPKEAIRSLEHVMKIKPDHQEALALLGDAYAQDDQLEKAIKTYQKVLETPLKENPLWFVRLSHGIGKAHLRMGKTEAAITMLKQAQAEDPNNIKVLKTLADAYIQAKLPENALEISKNVLHKKPEDIDVHLWYAKIAKSLDNSSDAIRVLKRANEINPDRQDVLISLGQTHYDAGNIDLARQTFTSIVNHPKTNLHDLKKVASYLLTLDDLPNATKALTKALELAKKSFDNTQEIVNTTIDLAKVYQLQDKQEKAIQLLDEISQDSNDLTIKLLKVRIFHSLGKTQAAIAALEDAFNLYPEHPECHFIAAQIYRSKGDLVPALYHASEVLAKLPQNQKARVLAAEISTSVLDKKESLKFLQSASINAQDNKHGWINNNQNAGVQYPCLRAEAALVDNNEVEAADALTQAMKINSSHPRVLAIQARLTARRGDNEAANEILNSAVETLRNSKAISRDRFPITSLEENSDNAQNPSEFPFAAEDYFGVTEASIELNRWESAISLSKKGAHLAPFEPKSHLTIARTLVLRAEMQRICNDLLIIEHAPGDIAIDKPAWDQFEEAIKKVELLIPDHTLSPNEDLDTLISQWQLRGEAVFSPNDGLIKNLEKYDSDDVLSISLIETLRLLNKNHRAADIANNLIIQQDDRSLTNPKQLIVIALGLAETDPHKAMITIQEAIESYPIHDLQKTPLLYALLSKTAFLDSDYKVAIEAIDKALEIWDNEANWHALAADIILAQEKSNNAKMGTISLSHQAITGIIDHRERCHQLLPNDINHQISLAKTYQITGRLFDAIKQLEDVVHEHPNHPEAWIALAEIYQDKGELDKAVEMSKKAIKLDESNSKNLLFFARLLVNTKKFKEAAEITKAIIHNNPKNPDGYYLLSKSLLGTDKKVDAIKALERALSLAPDDIKLELEKIHLLELTQGKESAFKSLQMLSEKYPNESVIQITYAKELLQRNQYEDAIAITKNALNLINNQDVADIKASELHFLLGHLYKKTGQLDHAIHHLSQSISLNPNNAKAYIEAGSTYQKQHQYRKAIESFKSAIEIAPNSSDAYYHAGLNYKSMKDYQNAESMFRKAAEYAPNDLSIHRQLGAMVAINLVHNRQNLAAVGAD